MIERHIYEDCQVAGIMAGHFIDNGDGTYERHPEYGDRHTIEILLKEGDKVPFISFEDRVTLIIEREVPNHE